MIKWNLINGKKAINGSEIALGFNKNYVNGGKSLAYEIPMKIVTEIVLWKLQALHLCSSIYLYQKQWLNYFMI